MIRLLDMFNKLEELNRMKEARLKEDDVSISAGASAANQPTRTQSGPVDIQAQQETITSEVPNG